MEYSTEAMKKEGFFSARSSPLHCLLWFIGQRLSHEMGTSRHFWVVPLNLLSSQETAGEDISHVPLPSLSFESRSKRKDR